MKAAGTLYLGKQTPIGAVATNGKFVLTMLAYDRQGYKQVVPWRLLWVGATAQTFFDAHRARLVPGVPLDVTAAAMQVLSGPGRNAGPEVQATVTDLRLPTTPTTTHDTAAN